MAKFLVQMSKVKYIRNRSKTQTMQLTENVKHDDGILTKKKVYVSRGGQYTNYLVISQYEYGTNLKFQSIEIP